jgi:hypothetical protein
MSAKFAMQIYQLVKSRDYDDAMRGSITTFSIMIFSITINKTRHLV